MCCRYVMELSPELRPYVEAAQHSPLLGKMVARLARPLITSGEVRPADIVPVLAPSPQQIPTVYPMVWGFSGNSSGKSSDSSSGRSSALFNARSETAAVKPTFRDSWAKRRCAIPASWYYEWEHLTAPDGRQKTGDKYCIQPTAPGIFFLAGLYRLEERAGLTVPVFTVLTREPTEELRRIHDRMPVILTPDSAHAWLSPDSRPERILQSAILDLTIEKAM